MRDKLDGHVVVRVSAKRYIVARINSGNVAEPGEGNLALYSKGEYTGPRPQDTMFPKPVFHEVTKPLNYLDALYCLARVYMGNSIPAQFQPKPPY